MVFVWSVLKFLKNQGVRTKTPKKRNLAIEEREAREKREPQASQATETRGEKHKQWREKSTQSTRRHNEANVAKATQASKLRVWWVACSPCSRAARARRAFGAGTFREFLERFCSELSGSIQGKAAKNAARSDGKHEERSTKNGEENQSKAPGGTTKQMAQRGESIVSMKIASVVGGVQPLLARAGCSKMPRAPQIIPKSLPEASRHLPELTLALLGLILPLLGVIWGLLGLILDLLRLPLGLLGRSWGSPGTLRGPSGEPLGNPKASQIAPGGSPGGPPLLSLFLAPFWDPFWVHFGTPRTSKNKVFVWRVCHFSKNRGVRKKHLKMET